MLKVFKNNNIHIKLEKDDIGIGAIEKLYYNYDMYPVRDDYCIGNFAMAADWSYNGGWNYYTITSIDLVALEEGKTVILYPLDEEYINEYILNEEI
jgi:hypothetical protein